MRQGRHASTFSTWPNKGSPTSAPLWQVTDVMSSAHTNSCRRRLRPRSLAGSDPMTSSGPNRRVRRRTHQEDAPREANVPTQPTAPRPQARFPRAHEHPRRTRGAEVPTRQGARSPVRLIHRIRTRQQFDELSRSGRRVRSDLLWCTYLPDPDQMPPTVAFAIGRVHGPAVIRNRLRRRLRAVCRDMATRGELPPGHWLWGITRSMSEQVCDMAHSALMTEMQSLVTAAAQKARATP